MSSTETATVEPGTANTYLEGNFAPIAHETTAWDLEVVGALPSELTGRYVRNGPNPLHADPANHHWFIGEGMVHGVRLAEGRARWYRSRYVGSPAVQAHKGLAEVPTADGGVIPGVGNTNAFHHAGAIWAISELSLPYRLTPELDTVAVDAFGGPLPNGMTAHPKFDPDTGAMHVMAYSFAPPHLLYHEISPQGEVVRTEEIAVGGPTMVHDMAMSSRWVVAFDLPVLFDLDLAAGGRRLPYAWDDGYPARLGLMPRSGTGADTVWVDIDPCYVFHPLNAFDDGDQLVIDLVRHPSMFRTDRDGPNEGPPVMERWRVDPVRADVVRTVLDERPQEFPRADERLAGRRHRYGYSVNVPLTDMGGGGDRTSSVLKYDLEAGTVDAHHMGPGRVAGEVVFVPAHDGAGEDEGWLLGYVHDAPTGRSELVVLDASDVTAAPVGRVLLPVRVPAGFHGNWVPDGALA